MSRSLVGYLFFIFLLTGCATMDTKKLSRQFSINPKAYSGNWHEIARTPNNFQDNDLKQDGKKYGPCYDSTANYTILDEEKIKVVNTCARKAKDGTQYREAALGEAQIVPNSDNRYLKVAFGEGAGRFFMKLFTGGGAPYWIYGIGQKNDAQKYEWSLVSTPKKNMVWILSRTPNLSSENLDEILGLAKAEGLPVKKLVFNKDRGTTRPSEKTNF